MKVTTKAVFQMCDDGQGGIAFDELERESYEHDGPVSLCGGGGGGKTTQVQKADPWSGQQPYLKDIFGEAQKQYKELPTQFYPGKTFAPMSQLEQEGLRGQLGYATGEGAEYQGMGKEALQQMLGAPESKYMEEYGGQLAQQMGQDFQDYIMPGIRSQSIGAGQLGSSRQGIAEGLAAGRQSEAMGRMRAGLMSDLYGKGLDQQARGMAYLPQIQQMGYQPGAVMQDVGAQMRGEQQKHLQDEMARWQAATGMPREDLARYMGTIQGNYGGTTSTSGQQGGSSGGLGGALGGAMMGASMAPMIGSGLAGMGIGGAAGPSAMLATGAANPMMIPLMIGGGLLGGM